MAVCPAKGRASSTTEGSSSPGSEPPASGVGKGIADGGGSCLGGTYPGGGRTSTSMEATLGASPDSLIANATRTR